MFEISVKLLFVVMPTCLRFICIGNSVLNYDERFVSNRLHFALLCYSNFSIFDSFHNPYETIFYISTHQKRTLPTQVYEPTIFVRYG